MNENQYKLICFIVKHLQCIKGHPEKNILIAPDIVPEAIRLDCEVCGMYAEFPPKDIGDLGR